MVRNRVEVMHGVNLDQLGRRDPEQYGTLTLDELEVRIKASADAIGLQTRFFRTNHEGEFVERLHRLEGLADGLLLNPGAWTHYSYAIRDALETDAAAGRGGPSVRRGESRGLATRVGDRAICALPAWPAGAPRAMRRR